MADSIREQIIAALVIRIKTAYPAVDVFRNPEKEDIDTDSDSDMIGIHNDEPEVSDPESYGFETITMLLRFRHLSKYPKPEFDETHGEKKSKHGELMLAELRKNITGIDRGLGGLCQSIKYDSGEIVFLEQYSEFVLVHAFFSVTYQTSMGDPYSLAS